MTNEFVGKFKNCHPDSTFIIFGCGPTVLSWSDDFSGGIKLGCNKFFMYDKDLDYLMIQDNGIFSSSPDCYIKNKQKYDEYEPRIHKLYGVKNPIEPHSMTESDCKRANAVKFSYSNSKPKVNSYPFFNLRSVVFSAIQFSILCGAKDVIIVGCDITNGLRVGETKPHNDYAQNKLIDKWRTLKLLIKDIDISIKVFKPIGLKGLFDEFKPCNE